VPTLLQPLQDPHEHSAEPQFLGDQGIETTGRKGIRQQCPRENALAVDSGVLDAGDEVVIEVLRWMAVPRQLQIRSSMRIAVIHRAIPQCSVRF
jgi:hypothetical protein